MFVVRHAAIDIMYRAILYNDQAAWSEMEGDRAVEYADMRAVICSGHSGCIHLDMGLGIDSCEYVTSIFEGPRASFVSRHTGVQAILTGGRSNVQIDYSLSFDSNFAERMRALVFRETSGGINHERVLEVLRLKARNPCVQFDVLPFLYENVRLSRDNTENQRPVNTLIAFRMLDEMNWKEFGDTGQLRFNRDEDRLKEDLRIDAEQFIRSLYTSDAIILHEAGALGVQALLLRFANLWHESQKKESSRILTGLLDFCISDLGYVPMTELSLIWRGISSKVVAPFFGPITGASKDVLTKVRSMAWDIMHLRLMERLATQSNLGSFYIPYFVSLDAKWRELLLINPIRVMLLDDSQRRMLCARSGELEFQAAFSNYVNQFPNEFSPEKVSARRKIASVPSMQKMKQLIALEEQRWSDS
ncbi:TPA: hypothetical protein L3965_000639 [Pseudomonas aeruginosa]|nr:hypothetical protein [Pseudomonas aeruginosa]